MKRLHLIFRARTYRLAAAACLALGLIVISSPRTLLEARRMIQTAHAALSCSLTATCNSPNVVILRISGSSYQFSRSITIDHAQVPNTDQTDFPVLVSGTYDGTGGTADLRTVANGGKVENASGYDVAFASDSSCSSLLSWETEKYTPTTGAVVYWVKVPTVYNNSATVFYLCYGNTNITSDQSSATSVWDGNYHGVWHLGETVTDEGTVADAYQDSTSNNTDGDQQGPDDTASGKVGTAQTFDGANDYINMGDPASGILDFDLNQSRTLSVWINRSATGVSTQPINKSTGAASGYALQINADNKVSALLCTNCGINELLRVDTTSATVPNTSQWYHLTATYDGSNTPGGVKIYIDGQSQSLTTVENSANGSSLTTEPFYLGARAAGTNRQMTGHIDEVRVSGIVRSADWITTEYNNQNSPATFYSIGSETATATADNGHAELPSESNYAQLVCCGGEATLSSSCSNAFEVVLSLSSTTNAHVEQNTQSNYTNNACISLSAGTISVGYQANNCNGFDTTLASISGSTNAHVGGPNTHTTKVCASTYIPDALTFTITDNTIGFGMLSSAAPRYATGDGSGSSSEIVAHRIDVSTNAEFGYALTKSGNTLEYGAHSIDPAGFCPESPATGIEQFGLRATAAGGLGTISYPYNTNPFYCFTADEIASASGGNGVVTAYSLRYVGSIAPATEAGDYATALTYVVTANF